MRHRVLASGLGLLFAVTAVAAEAPPERWTLAEAVRIAAAQSPAVTLAELRVREADARVGQARAALLPSVTGTASVNNRTTASVTTMGINHPQPSTMSPTANTTRVISGSADSPLPFENDSNMPRICGSTPTKMTMIRALPTIAISTG